MRDLLQSMLPVLKPLFDVFLSLVAPILITWITVRIASLLKVNDDQKKAELEKGLREALHKAAQNALLFAMTKYGIKGGLSTNLSDTIMDLSRKANAKSEGSSMAQARLDDLVTTAVNEYLIPKMPETIEKLKVTPQGLSDIVLSKAPMV